MASTVAEPDPGPPAHTVRRALDAYRQRVRGFSRNVKLHFACILLRSAAFALFELFLNLYVLSLGFETAFIGLCSTLLGIASLVCSLPAGVIADRIGRRRAMIIGLLGISLTHLGLSVSSQGWAIISF